MPLSKARDRERKRIARLESCNVQPKPLIRYGIEENTGKRVELDADGNIVPEYT